MVKIQCKIFKVKSKKSDYICHSCISLIYISHILLGNYKQTNETNNIRAQTNSIQVPSFILLIWNTWDFQLTTIHEIICWPVIHLVTYLSFNNGHNHTHKHTHTHIYIHTKREAYTHIHTSKWIYTKPNIYTQTHRDILNTHTSLLSQITTWTYIYALIYIYMYFFYLFICIYIYWDTDTNRYKKTDF